MCCDFSMFFSTNKIITICTKDQLKSLCVIFIKLCPVAPRRFCQYLRDGVGQGLLFTGRGEHPCCNVLKSAAALCQCNLLQHLHQQCTCNIVSTCSILSTYNIGNTCSFVSTCYVVSTFNVVSTCNVVSTGSL